jgi:four helix bundle protein
MAGIKDFEDIIVWQLAITLAQRVNVKFKDHKDFSFRDQIMRASYSVSNNIAEGFDRGSNRDFRRFLRVARGSCNEVRSMAVLGHGIGYLDKDELISLREDCLRTSATIQAFIKSMRIDALKSFAPWLLPFAHAVGYA